MDDFLSELGSRPDSDKITNLLSLDIYHNKWIPKLNSHELNYVELSFFGDDWLAFNQLVTSFVKLANQLDPWSSLQSFDLYATYLNDLSLAFTNNLGFHLVDLVKNSIEIVLPLALKLDSKLLVQENYTRPRSTFLAAVLLKIFNNIRSQNNDVKKKIILFVSNKLCYLYFKLSNPSLCRNVFVNMNNAGLIFNQFSLFERIQYRYFLGKYYLYKDQLIDSFTHLNWCVMNSYPSDKNLNLVLELLLPIGMIIGKGINFDYIRSRYSSQPQFLNLYENLHKYLHSGDYNNFFSILSTNQGYLKDRKLFLLLSNKSKVILLRNLSKKLWLIKNKPSALHFDDFKPVLNLINYSSDDDNIQNILINLTDQGFIKGKIIPKTRSIVLSKSDTFSKIDKLYQKFSYGHSDKWME